jgi:hypothetical protein
MGIGSSVFIREMSNELLSAASTLADLVAIPWRGLTPQEGSKLLGALQAPWLRGLHSGADCCTEADGVLLPNSRPTKNA